MRLIYFTFQATIIAQKLNYVELENTLDEKTQKNYFCFNKKTFFRFRSFYLKTLITCPLSFLMKVLFSLDLGSSFAAYLMSLFPSLYYEVLSLFLALDPLFYSLLLCNPTYSRSLRFPHPSLEPSLLSCHPLRVFPLMCPTSFFSHVA